jgi:rare lipoprotein A
VIGRSRARQLTPQAANRKEGKLRRFRRRRRRLAAIALLPAATAATTSLAAAPALAQEIPPSDGTAEEGLKPDEGRAPTKTTIRAKRHVMADEAVKISGRVRPARDGAQVVVHLPGEDAVTRTGPSGGFGVSWRPNGPGDYRVRASTSGDETSAGSESKPQRVTAYREASASWYGPGLYGNGLACGGTLSPSTVGVAHRSMPCGTNLELRYHGRTVRAKVIDRGPFIGSREFDLTAATKQRLGFPSTGTVLVSR